jgi:uncharacterized protein (TIGR03435 family)
MRSFSKLLWRFSLASLCLMTGPALLSVPAATQASREGNSADSTQTRKQFAFEVVSIRPHKPGAEMFDTQYLPNGYKASFRLEGAIMQAYISGPFKQLSSKILNAPAWVADDWYDIDARVAEEDMAAWQQAQGGIDSIDSELLHSALQTVLKERFKLVLHISQTELPYLDLTVDKHGAKLKDTVPGAVKPVVRKTYGLGRGFYIENNGQRQFVGVSMDEFSRVLMRLTDHLVQDKTGLTGRYDFTLRWYGYQQNPASEISNPLDRMPINSIGLTLKPGRGPGFIIDIDHIERPDPN